MILFPGKEIIIRKRVGPRRGEKLEIGSFNSVPTTAFARILLLLVGHWPVPSTLFFPNFTDNKIQLSKHGLLHFVRDVFDGGRNKYFFVKRKGEEKSLVSLSVTP